MVQNTQEQPALVDDSFASPLIRQSGGIAGPGGAISHYQMQTSPDGSFMVFGSKERPGASPMWVADLRRHLHFSYDIEEPASGWRSIESFADAEKAKLRPVAETLAMLAGNAFFGMVHDGREHYESYLPEASALYEANGGDAGWASEASFGGGAKQPSTTQTDGDPASELNLLSRAEAAEARLAEALEAGPTPAQRSRAIDAIREASALIKKATPKRAILPRSALFRELEDAAQALGRGDGRG